MALLLGVAVVAAAVPWIVRHSPVDASRLCTILDSCRSGHAPAVVVLGNSVAMFAIDAADLRGWNLASPAQTPTESLLLLQELPDEVRTVVQVLTPMQLADDAVLAPERYNAMVLCGFRPREETSQAVARAFGSPTAAALDIHPLVARIAARQHMRPALETMLRDLARGGSASRRRILRDLERPAAPIDGGWLPDRLFVAIGRRPVAVRASQRRIVAESLAASRQAGRRHLLVLAPVHPEVRSRFEPVVCPAQAECLDLSGLLGASEFLDPTHPTPSGARKVTASIAAALAAGE